MPAQFDRLTATVEGADGSPLAGLAVRVEGHDTGVVTDGNGGFVLTANDFPQGVEAENEISLGRNGVIVGSETVVPVDSPVLNLQFGTPVVGDPGSISGNIFNAVSGDPLNGAEITAFSDTGGVLVATSTDGKYNFDSVAPGTWQISAYAEGFHPKTAMVMVEAGQDVIQHLALSPAGTVSPGEGLKIKGTLRDADTGLPVGNATVTMYADTGYYGVPEPGIMEDVDNWTESGEAAMGAAGEAKGGSSMAPFIYDPSYQETTTDAAGYFEFPDEVIAYSIWLDYFAEGYLNGNHYEYVEGQTGVKTLELEIEPYVATDISGTVVDENGDPVSGAYVEFIFNGFGGPMPMDMAVPGGVALEDIAADGNVLFETFGTPPPQGDMRGEEDNWSDWGDAEASMPSAGSMGGVDTDGFFGGPNVDNEIMMRFRFEQQEAAKAGSDVGYFEGYYSATTGEDGTFEFTDVPAGSYYMFASAYRHIPYSNNIEIMEDPAENIEEILLPNVPVGSVEGIIVDDHGVPVEDVLVNATQPFADPFTYTDSTGHYRIDNIPVGTWNIGAYKKGYLTTSQQTEITDGGVASINLTITVYNPPDPTLIAYTGHVVNGSDNSMVSGADLVFTPVNDEYGGYFQHVVSDGNGGFACQMIPTEYNVLIQREGYEDLYIRIWIDALYPEMDFWLWPIGAGGGGFRGGPWGGVAGEDGTVTVEPDEMPVMPPPNEI